MEVTICWNIVEIKIELKHMFDCDMMNTVENKRLQLNTQKTHDKKHLISFWLFVCVMILGLFSYLMIGRQANGQTAQIYVDGKLFREVSLVEEQSFDIVTEHGVNQIEISNGAIRVVSADCANQICVNQGAQSKEGSVISCIPHGIVISIHAGGEVDTVAY